MVVTARPAIWAMVRKVGRPLADDPSGARRLPRREGRDFVVTKLSPPSATGCLLRDLPSVVVEFRGRRHTTPEPAIDFKAGAGRRSGIDILRWSHGQAEFFAFAQKPGSRCLAILPHLPYCLRLRSRRIGNRQSGQNRLVLDVGSRLRSSILVGATDPHVQLAAWPPEGRRECKSLLATRSKPGLPANG